MYSTRQLHPLDIGNQDSRIDSTKRFTQSQTTKVFFPSPRVPQVAQLRGGSLTWPEFFGVLFGSRMLAVDEWASLPRARALARAPSLPRSLTLHA